MNSEQRLTAALLLALVTASHIDTRADLEALRAQCTKVKS